MHPAVVDNMHEAGRARREAQVQEAEARRQKPQELKTLELETKKAKVDLEIAKTLSETEQRKASVRMEELKAKKQISLEREQQIKADVRHVRQYFVSRLCKRLLDYYHNNRKDHAAQIKELENTTTAQAKKESRQKTSLRKALLSRRET